MYIQDCVHALPCRMAAPSYTVVCNIAGLMSVLLGSLGPCPVLAKTSDRRRVPSSALSLISRHERRRQTSKTHGVPLAVGQVAGTRHMKKKMLVRIVRLIDEVDQSAVSAALDEHPFFLPQARMVGGRPPHGMLFASTIDAGCFMPQKQHGGKSAAS